jgi:hypothetical protein
MNSTTIAQVLTMPDKSAIDSISGTMVEVYKARTVTGGKTAQDAKLRDGTGSEIKLTLWDRPDHSMYKGREVIIQAGPKGGLVVKFDGYQQRNVNTLSVSAGCTFQYLEVHNAQTGGAVSAPAASAHTGASGEAGGHSGRAANGQGQAAPIMVNNGAKVGMALNNACQFLVAAGEQFSVARVNEIASELIRLSNRMEQGELAPEAAQDKPF